MKLTSPIDFIETNHLIINKKYSTLMEQIGFDSFDSIYDHSSGDVIKKIKDKAVMRLEFQHENIKHAFYLKRHDVKFAALARLLSPFASRLRFSQGRLEFENICSFRNCKFPTVVPVAAGEKFVRIFWAKSFLITEDFSPFVSLEELLVKQPQLFMGPDGQNRKEILLNSIARLAREMHRQGFNHLDFNATHILLHYDNESSVPKIALFDFQRVDKRKFFRFRWKIKSLARLNYSLPHEIFSEKDRMDLFLFYLNKKRLRSFDRLQWLWVKRKTARIKHHTDKILAKREAVNK
ncbi:MAG: hypothetical protein JSU83_12015 [Deltaproteobacteria bacterium]|nr:MAG: hypothetical protein JSU83_12015 [Deltaproteobacteria bacterium]